MVASHANSAVGPRRVTHIHLRERGETLQLEPVWFQTWLSEPDGVVRERCLDPIPLSASEPDIS